MAAWTDEQKQRALAIYAEHGPREAARETGIPLSTVGTWAKAAGVTFNAERTARATEVRQMRWAERRANLTDLFGQAAEELVEKARTAEDAGDAKQLMLAAAIGVDKAQLLSGGVTSRHEQLDAERRQARISEMFDELEQRRQAKNAGSG